MSYKLKRILILGTLGIILGLPAFGAKEIVPLPALAGQSNETKRGENYPYLAKLPPELEGKLELAYNYGFDPAGKTFWVKREWRIFSKIEHIQIQEIVRDGNGNDISTHKIVDFNGNVSLFYAFGIGPLDPKKWKIIYGETKGKINYEILSKLPPTPIDSWTVEQKIIYFRLP